MVVVSLRWIQTESGRRVERFAAFAPLHGRSADDVVAFMRRDGWAEALDEAGGDSLEGGPESVTVEVIDGVTTVVARGYAVRRGTTAAFPIAFPVDLP